MKIKKGEIIRCDGGRNKGKFIGMAINDFDTNEDEFWDVKIHQDIAVHGISAVWFKGDKIPMRRGLSKILGLTDYQDIKK